MELIKEEKVQIETSEPYPQQCKSVAIEVQDEDRETNESTIQMDVTSPNNLIIPTNVLTSANSL